jgi:hypothetical protein
MSVTAQQRQIVRDLAGNCCEFCRIAEGQRLVKFQIDHIIPIKHGGTDTVQNLCLACLECNSYKGPNVAALDPLTRNATKLYDPRQQVWDEHFRINADATLTGLTPEGRATLQVLRINEGDRVKQRLGELRLGEYPCVKDEPSP